MARMVIPVNFLDESDYEFVKSKPNRCYYIRELVRKDRENQKHSTEYIDEKIKELEELIKSLGETNTPKDEKDKNIIKNILDMY